MDQDVANIRMVCVIILSWSIYFMFMLLPSGMNMFHTSLYTFTANFLEIHDFRHSVDLKPKILKEIGEY